jgi:hypothetical protein
MSRPTVVKTIAVTIDDIKHHGTYYVQSGVVCVQSEYGSKATHVGRLPPENVARLLPLELVRS